MGALLAECLLPREKLNTTREMEEERERGGEQGGSQSHEERKARIEERSQTDMRALYSSCLFFVLAAVQYAVPFMGQQKVQCSLLL